MKAKDMQVFVVWCSLLSVSLCMYMSSVVTGLGMVSYLLPLILWLLGFSFQAGDEHFYPHTSILVSMMLLSILLAVLIRRRYTLDLCFEPSVVTCVEGRVVYDSSFTENGNHLMKISLFGCRAVTGDSGSAKGVVTVLGDTQAIISYGVRVRLQGRFSEGLFIYEEIQVLSRGFLNDVREYLMTHLQTRLLGQGGDQASLLSSLLLLGRAESSTMAIKDRAVSCGCAHVLALSGMHLGILAAMCRRLFGGRRLSKVISCLVVIAFVFVAGPRPSLLRAALAFFLSFLPSRMRILCVFLLQMILFPVTMVELGCCYGYAAVFAIVFISPYLEAAMYQLGGRLAFLVCASTSVLVFCIPVQMASNGCWSPSVILVSPLAGFLAAFSMVMGILLLIFGRVDFLLQVNGFVYNAMDGLFGLFEFLPKAGWVGYGILLASLSLVLLSVLLLRRAMRRRALRESGVIDLQSSTDLNFGL